MANSSVKSAAFWVFAILFFTLPPSAGPALPNMVYILTDDLGIGDVTGYNPASKVPTPEMDAFMSQGMRFTDAHSNSSVCTPTRYGVLTGRYAWRSRLKSGVLDTKSKRLIEPGRMTVASLLKKQGYRTACIGKWHLGLDWADTGDWSKGFKNGPTAVGFDSYFGIPASLDMEDYAYIENDQVVQAPTGKIGGSSWPAFWRAGKIAPDFHHVEVLPKMADKAVAWLGDQKNAGPGKPFFLYLALPSPHTPHVPMPSMIGKSQAGVRGDYVAETDWAVGRVLKALDSLGLSQQTLVVVTSDNGAHDNTYKQYGHTPHMGYRGEKADIFEAGHRIPFSIRWPGVVKAGAVSKEVVCLTDFMATAAAITGFRLPDSAGEDSYSLLPVLLGETLPGPLREATVHHSINGTFAIRQGAWKLAVDNMGSGGFTDPETVAGPGTLFDIIKNPGEDSLKDQYAAQPAVVKELRALLDKYKKDGRSTPKNRTDAFWQGPTAIGEPGSDRASAPLRFSPRLFTRGGGELRITGAGEGAFQAALVGMDGRTVWRGVGRARNGEAGIFSGRLEPGLYVIRITGDGWNARASLFADPTMMEVLAEHGSHMD